MQSRRAFLLYLLAMLFWSLGSFMIHSGIGNTLLWFRLMSSVGLASIIMLFRFVQTVLNRRKRWAEWAYLYFVIIAALSLFTPLVFPSASIENGELIYELGLLALLLSPPIYALYLFSLFELAQAYRRSEDIMQRNRLRYLMLGLGFVIVASPINFTPLGKYPIDIAANGVNALLIAYAIVRHELLDIRVVVRRSLAYATLVLVLSLTYLAPILILELAIVKLPTGLSLSGVLLALGIGVIIAGTVHLFYENIRDRIDRLFFRERYDAYQMVQELSDQITGTLNLDRIVSILLDRLIETLHLNSVGLLLRHPALGYYTLTASKGVSPDVPDFRLRPDHAICRWLTNEARVLTALQLDIQPQFSSLWQEEIDLLSSLSPELFVALRSKGDLIGILFVGSKQSSEAYTQEDITLFSTLASQVAIALENARLFQETNLRLAEQIALFEVGESLARTDRLDDILQLVVNHACLAESSVSRAVIHLVDHEMKRLIPRAVSQTDGDSTFAVGFGLDQGIAGRAIREHRMIYLPDVRNAPDFVETGELFISLVVVPLIVEDVPEGTLSVTSPKASAFSTDALRQLASLGNQAAIAVRKAQMTERLRTSLSELESRSVELEASLAELQTAQKQLIQAGKLASLGTLSAGIAHEINNPLAGIKLFAQNLIRYQSVELLTPEKLTESLEKINSLVDKAADIIEHLRAFSRQASGKLEPIDVNQPVEDALSMLSEQLRLRNIDVSLDVDKDLPPVLGDSNQIEQVMVNLITNARDAVEKAERKEISLRAFHSDGFVVIEVADTGCGIPPDHLDRIFDPFFTTKAIGRGTGLGLAISHGIVEYHGGDIEVETTLDEGTTFRVKLPVADS